MKLTIGMPVYNDYSGVFMTVNALRHYQDLSDCEILIVNNAPDSRQTYELKAICNSASDVTCRYVDYQEATGAANAKNAVAWNAQGDFVLVVDSHVLLTADAIAKTKAFFDMVPGTNNLYQGPIIMHSLEDRAKSTHLYPKWGSGMYGQWATAWKTNDGRFVQTFHRDGKLSVSDLMTNEAVSIPDMDWSNHEETLESWGWQLAIKSGEPFEIPAQGGGLFAFRREAWLGFNKDFREFGGEEYYLQDKYRSRGYRTYCLPWLQWHHRFYRENQPNYPNRLESKFRNFVLGYDELGKDKTEMIAHFESLGMNKTIMQQILEDPNSLEMVVPTKEEFVKLVQPVDNDSRRKLYEKTVEGNDNFLLKIMATRKAHVTEISTDPATAICLLAGDPKVMVSYVPKATPDMKSMQALLPLENYHKDPITWHLHETDITKIPTIEPTEFLFIKSEPEHSIALLNSLYTQVSRIIVLDDLPAVDDFLNIHVDWTKNPVAGGRVVLSLQQRKPDVYGAGTELSRVLGWFGYKPTPGCKCKDKAHAMNIKGIEWCKTNEKLIVDWLAEEHKKSGTKIPFCRPFVRMLVRACVKVASMRGAK